MQKQASTIRTAADLIAHIMSLGMPGTQQRDSISAVNRIADLSGQDPSRLDLNAPNLRRVLNAIRPAKWGLAKKSYANIRSTFGAALALAGIVDRLPRGLAARDPAWAPLVAILAGDTRLAGGLALFANWCSTRSVAPARVTDATVRDFREWLTNATIYPHPEDRVRGVPIFWNDARSRFSEWPQTPLTRLSFRTPSAHLAWADLGHGLRADGERYLAMRAGPDPFDDRPNAPSRPLAPSTLRQQREHIRLAVSILARKGTPLAEITSLADLVAPAAVKAILRWYHERSGGRPSAFAVAFAQTLLQIARFHTGATDDQLGVLKKIASKLPGVLLDLTAKNKALLREFDSQQRCAALFGLPEQLISEAHAEPKGARVPLVKAQVGVAIDILLVAPVRPQNLARLNWRHHIREPNGPRGGMQLLIPAGETKTKKRDLVFEIPPDVARRLRWYRSFVISRIGADPSGPLFVTLDGEAKHQATLTQQLTEIIGDRVGVFMTPHQFRHLAAKLYLDERPEDFETVRSLLGHSYGKTTLIYAGAASQRASRAFASIVIEKREQFIIRRRRSGKKPPLRFEA